VEDTYRTIKSQSKGYYKAKGSKFIAYAFPVKTENEIKDILSQLKKEHHSARHHCFAWRLGTETITWRANDDGEPSSTAGKPILGQLQRFGLTRVLLVVVRYFGGTLLGTGGLIQAYRSAAADALAKAQIVKKIIAVQYRLLFTYQQMNEVMRIVEQENLNVDETRFEMNCELTLSVRKSKAEKTEKMFTRIPGVKIKNVDKLLKK